MQLYFCLLYLVLTLSVCSENPENDKETSNDDDESFVPTREWQVVKKGQKIPKGLHVRVNLETGLTEAKLLDKNENEKTRAVAEVLEANDVDAQDSNSEVGGNLKFSEAELKEALRNIKNEDVPQKEHFRTNKFRSYEELKKDLSDLNLIPKTDAELLNELVAKHRRILKDKSYEASQILSILEDLEYLVHQYDNANEFIKLDGFREVIFRNLNSSNGEIKREALKLLGSSVQNNAKVQIHALETGCIGILLRIVALDTDYSVKNRAVFALSSLLRRFPMAQLKFVENAGLSVFEKLLEKTGDIKIQLKIATLVNDLVLEHQHALEDTQSTNHSEKVRQYNQISLKEKLKEHNWCENLNRLLINAFKIDSNDHDAIEKCLHAIISILNTCDAKSVKSVKDVVRNLQLIYRDIALVEEEKGEDFEYYTHLWNLCRQITEYSEHRYKSEL